MKKINNLNEQINRMKQLMGESRLYGNLVESNGVLLTEGVGTGTLLRGLKKTDVRFKNIDPKFLPDEAFNFPTRSLDDITTHLKTYPQIWKALIPDEATYTRTIKIIDAIQNPKPGGVTLFKIYDGDPVFEHIPDVGGLREAALAHYIKSTDLSNLPAKYVDQSTGYLAIPDQNTGGMILFDAKGDIVKKLDADGNEIKIDSSNVKKKDPKSPDVEDVVYEVVNDTDVNLNNKDEINGKTIKTSEQNAKSTTESVNKTIESAYTNADGITYKQMVIIDSNGTIIDVKMEVVEKRVSKELDEALENQFNKTTKGDLKRLGLWNKFKQFANKKTIVMLRNTPLNPISFITMQTKNIMDSKIGSAGMQRGVKFATTFAIYEGSSYVAYSILSQKMKLSDEEIAENHKWVHYLSPLAWPSLLVSFLPEGTGETVADFMKAKFCFNLSNNEFNKEKKSCKDLYDQADAWIKSKINELDCDNIPEGSSEVVVKDMFNNNMDVILKNTFGFDPKAPSEGWESKLIGSIESEVYTWLVDDLFEAKSKDWELAYHKRKAELNCPDLTAGSEKAEKEDMPTIKTSTKTSTGGSSPTNNEVLEPTVETTIVVEDSGLEDVEY
jgi:hypothetical protein